MPHYNTRRAIRENKSLSGFHKRTFHIERILRQCAGSRGQYSEKYVGMALEELKADGKIIGYYLTNKWSRQDKEQIDAVAFRLDGTKVILQIKSSPKAAQKFRKDKRHDDIRVVFVEYCQTQGFNRFKERIYNEILHDWHGWDWN